MTGKFGYATGTGRIHEVPNVGARMWAHDGSDYHQVAGRTCLAYQCGKAATAVVLVDLGERTYMPTIVMPVVSTMVYLCDEHARQAVNWTGK